MAILLFCYNNISYIYEMHIQLFFAYLANF